jgi:hypothetical protein
VQATGMFRDASVPQLLAFFAPCGKHLSMFDVRGLMFDAMNRNSELNVERWALSVGRWTLVPNLT